MSARYVFPIALVFSVIFIAPDAHAAGQFKYAQAAVYFDGASQVLSKRVRKVTNPQTGIFCIKTAFNMAYDYMGVAAVEVGSSNGNDLLAHWVFGAGDCPNQDRWMEVQTFDQDISGNWVLTNDASWVFYVP